MGRHTQSVCRLPFWYFFSSFDIMYSRYDVCLCVCFVLYSSVLYALRSHNTEMPRKFSITRILSIALLAIHLCTLSNAHLLTHNSWFFHVYKQRWPNIVMRKKEKQQNNVERERESACLMVWIADLCERLFCKTTTLQTHIHTHGARAHTNSFCDFSFALAFAIFCDAFQDKITPDFYVFFFIWKNKWWHAKAKVYEVRIVVYFISYLIFLYFSYCCRCCCCYGCFSYVYSSWV